MTRITNICGNGMVFDGPRTDTPKRKDASIRIYGKTSPAVTSKHKILHEKIVAYVVALWMNIAKTTLGKKLGIDQKIIELKIKTDDVENIYVNINSLIKHIHGNISHFDSAFDYPNKQETKQIREVLFTVLNKHSGAILTIQKLATETEVAYVAGKNKYKPVNTHQQTDNELSEKTKLIEIELKKKSEKLKLQQEKYATGLMKQAYTHIKKPTPENKTPVKTAIEETQLRQLPLKTKKELIKKFEDCQKNPEYIDFMLSQFYSNNKSQFNELYSKENP